MSTHATRSSKRDGPIASARARVACYYLRRGDATLNLRFLETFIWVAKLRSFSLAAEKVHATQAGVSARIAALERELGARLLQRDVRDVRLTTEGLIAFEQAELIIHQVSQLKASIRDPTTIQGSIRIGVIDTISFTWLPELGRVCKRRTFRVHDPILMG